MTLLQKYSSEYKQIYVNFKVCRNTWQRNQFRRGKGQILLSEILFLAFEGDTLWVYFFKSETNAHILYFFVLNASPSYPFSSVPFPQEWQLHSWNKHCVFNKVESWDPKCDCCLFRQFKYQSKSFCCLGPRGFNNKCEIGTLLIGWYKFDFTCLQPRENNTTNLPSAKREYYN